MPHHSNGRIEAAAEKASCHKRAVDSCGSSYEMLRWVAFYVALAYLSSAKGQECRLASPVQSQESRTPIHQTEAEAWLLYLLLKLWNWHIQRMFNIHFPYLQILEGLIIYSH